MHIKIDLKIFIFALLFLLTNRIDIYASIMLFALIHELGHLLLGLILGFKPKNIVIMPYGVKLNFKINYQDYNKKLKNGNVVSLKKIAIALAGPLLNLILFLITMFITIYNGDFKFLGITNQNIMYSNILIFMFNLIPIYPLDGGRIVQEIVHIFKGLHRSYTYIQDISWISIAIFTAICSVLILYYKNFALLVVLVYLWYLVIKTEREFTMKTKIYDNISKYLVKKTCKTDIKML